MHCTRGKGAADASRSVLVSISVALFALSSLCRPCTTILSRPARFAAAAAVCGVSCVQPSSLRCFRVRSACFVGSDGRWAAVCGVEREARRVGHRRTGRPSTLSLPSLAPRRSSPIAVKITLGLDRPRLSPGRPRLRYYYRPLWTTAGTTRTPHTAYSSTHVINKHKIHK